MKKNLLSIFVLLFSTALLFPLLSNNEKVDAEKLMSSQKTTVKKPDLRVYNLSGPDTVLYSTEMSFMFILKNEGNADAGHFIVYYFLKRKGASDDNRISYGATSYPGLKKGEFVVVKSEFMLGDLNRDVISGEYVFVAHVDMENKIDESDETNNRIKKDVFTITRYYPKDKKNPFD
jgi:CARDB